MKRGERRELDEENVLGRERSPLWFSAVAALVAWLPYRALRALGGAIGVLAGSLLRVRRAHVEAAMHRAGVASPAEVASAMYASLGRGVAELLWVAGRPPESVDGCFTMEPAAEAALREALAKGRGVVVATAHTGNWDMTACAAARWLAERGLSPALTVVTKRLSWRSLDRAWQRLRRERGVSLVAPRGASSQVAAALARGEVVALLVDQAPERAQRVARAVFLGETALHDLAPTLLAARAVAPIAMLFGRRDASGVHRLGSAGVIWPEEVATAAGRVAATKRIARELERFVLDHPDQWLWLHRRWKRPTESLQLKPSPHTGDEALSPARE